MWWHHYTCISTSLILIVHSFWIYTEVRQKRKLLGHRVVDFAKMLLVGWLTLNTRVVSQLLSLHGSVEEHHTWIINLNHLPCCSRASLAPSALWPHCTLGKQGLPWSRQGRTSQTGPSQGDMFRLRCQPVDGGQDQAQWGEPGSNSPEMVKLRWEANDKGLAQSSSQGKQGQPLSRLPAVQPGSLFPQPPKRPWTLQPDWEQGCSWGPDRIPALIIIIGAEVQILTFALFNRLIYLAVSFLNISLPVWMRTE